MKKGKLGEIEMDIIKFLVIRNLIAFKNLENKKLNLHETKVAIKHGISIMEIILKGIFNFDEPDDKPLCEEKNLARSVKIVNLLNKKHNKSEDQNVDDSIN